MEKAVIGIDQSLRSTGVCLIKGNTILHHLIKPKNLKGIKRLLYIQQELLKIIKTSSIGAICMEGYSYESLSHAHSLGEIGGIIKLLCANLKTPFYIVPPTLVKLFATGIGSATKENMMSVYNLKQDDLADSQALAEIASFLYTKETPLKRHQLEVLKKVKANPENLQKYKKKIRIKKKIKDPKAVLL